MAELNEIFKGLYGGTHTLAVVFDKYGEVIWISSEAEALIQSENLRVCDVYFEMSNHPDSSGSLKFGFGGKFNKTEILGTECFIAELYDEIRLLELFTDPRIAKFVQENDASLRRSVTGISALCDSINSVQMKPDDKKEVQLYLNLILSSCCSIINKTTMLSLLAATVENMGADNDMIAFDDFMNELKEGCSEALGKSCEVSVTESCGGFVNANKMMLTYLVLMLIRRLIDSLNFNEFKLELSSSEKNDRIKLSIAVISAFEEEKFNASRESLRLNEDVLKIMSEKLDAKFTFYGSMLNVSFKCVEKINEAELRSSEIILSDGTFSPYNFILNESGNFRTHY